MLHKNILFECQLFCRVIANAWIVPCLWNIIWEEKEENILFRYFMKRKKQSIQHKKVGMPFDLLVWAKLSKFSANRNLQSDNAMAIFFHQFDLGAKTHF